MHDDEQAIRQLVTTWLAASAEGDTEKVLSLMADEVVFLASGQPPMCGKSAFAVAQAGLDQVRIEARSEIEEIRVLGDWAYLWTTLSIVVTPKQGGEPVRRKGNTLSILSKQTGTWLLVRDANMLAVVRNGHAGTNV